MLPVKIKIVNSLTEAVTNRKVKGVRFDNSSYWRRYYIDKYKSRNVDREKRYAEFLLKRTNKKRVLDLATGYGFLPVELKKLNFDVTCLDEFDRMIEMAKEYFRENDVDIKIIKADVVNLPFGNNIFDIVTAMSILEHLSKEEICDNLIPEMKRVLGINGWLLIHVPVKSWVTIFKRWYRKKILRDLPDWAIDDDGDVTHKTWIDVDEYAHLLVKTGLKVEYIGFNYIRSNDKTSWMRILSWLFGKIDGDFYKYNGKRVFWENLLERFCSSAVFICRKVK